MEVNKIKQLRKFLGNNDLDGCILVNLPSLQEKNITMLTGINPWIYVHCMIITHNEIMNLTTIDHEFFKLPGDVIPITYDESLSELIFRVLENRNLKKLGYARRFSLNY